MPTGLSHAFRAITQGLPHLVVGGVPPVRAGDDQLAWHRLGLHTGSGITLVSDAFSPGGEIPAAFTAEGKGDHPPLRWGDLPQATRSLALIVEDPDAPTPKPFVHWIVSGIRPDAGDIDAALRLGACEGINSMFLAGWAPCAPPRGDDPHRYFFQLFALDTTHGLDQKLGRSALLQAIRGHVLGQARTFAWFER